LSLGRIERNTLNGSCPGPGLGAFERYYMLRDTNAASRAPRLRLGGLAKAMHKPVSIALAPSESRADKVLAVVVSVARPLSCTVGDGHRSADL
jgi:hypothetical protein